MGTKKIIINWDDENLHYSTKKKTYDVFEMIHVLSGVIRDLCIRAHEIENNQTKA